MGNMLAPEEYARISAEAYRRRVLAQVREHGTPAADPTRAGERAAVLATAGQAWADESARSTTPTGCGLPSAA